MTNSMWVTLLYFFARMPHWSFFIPWPIASEWHCFISLPGTLTSIMFHPMTNSKWVTLLYFLPGMFHPMNNSMWVTLLYFFTVKPYWSCFIQWPTVCEWHCFISFPGSLTNHVSSHNQQYVSDTALFICQTVSLIVFHPMTNRMWVTLLISLPGSLTSIMFHPMTSSMWVTLLYFFSRKSHWSCFIP